MNISVVVLHSFSTGAIIFVLVLPEQRKNSCEVFKLLVTYNTNRLGITKEEQASNVFKLLVTYSIIRLGITKGNQLTL